MAVFQFPNLAQSGAGTQTQNYYSGLQTPNLYTPASANGGGANTGTPTSTPTTGTANPFGIDNRGWLTYNGQSYNDRYDPRLYGALGRSVTTGNRDQSTGYGTTFNSQEEAMQWLNGLDPAYRAYFSDPTDNITESNYDEAGNHATTHSWQVGLTDAGRKYLNGRVQLYGGAGVGSNQAGQGFNEVSADMVNSGGLTYDPVFGVLVDPSGIKGPDNDPSGLFRGGPLQNILTGVGLVVGGAGLAGAFGGLGAGTAAGSGAAATIPESLLTTLPEAGSLATGGTALSTLPEVSLIGANGAVPATAGVGAGGLGSGASLVGTGLGTSGTLGTGTSLAGTGLSATGAGAAMGLPAATDVGGLATSTIPGVGAGGGFNLSNLSNIGGNLFGSLLNHYLGNRTQGQLNNIASGMDPFGQYRPFFANNLMQMYQDPKKMQEWLDNNPAYQANLAQGIQGINRGAAARGYVRSANPDYDIAKFTSGLAAQTMDKELEREMRMAGAYIDPNAAGQIRANGVNQSNAFDGAAYTQLWGAASDFIRWLGGLG